MKLRELAGLLGWRVRPKTYGFELRQFELPTDGLVEYAQWLHPGDSPKTVAIRFLKDRETESSVSILPASSMTLLSEASFIRDFNADVFNSTLSLPPFSRKAISAVSSD